MVNEKIAVDHGLKKTEFKEICKLLKRVPNITELGLFSAMWNEHCSYKSSKIHLKKLPTAGKKVIQGPGENAGVVDIGDDDAIVFKIVSGGDTYTNDGSISSLSDKRAKKNIIDLEDGLSIVNQLKPKTFQYNGKTDLGVDDGKTRFGFIADDVLEVASQYVEIGNAKIDGVEVDDFKSLSTTRMIPMMVKAIQELSEKVEELESKISGSS